MHCMNLCFTARRSDRSKRGFVLKSFKHMRMALTTARRVSSWTIFLMRHALAMEHMYHRRGRRTGERVRAEALVRVSMRGPAVRTSRPHQFVGFAVITTCQHTVGGKLSFAMTVARLLMRS